MWIFSGYGTLACKSLQGMLFSSLYHEWCPNKFDWFISLTASTNSMWTFSYSTKWNRSKDWFRIWIFSGSGTIVWALFILGNVRPIHGVSYPQILFIYLINYFNEFNLNIRHFTLTPISNPLFDTATWRPFCLFTSLILFVQISVIYQKKAFWELYNIVLTLIYKKMQSTGRKSI